MGIKSWLKTKAALATAKIVDKDADGRDAAEAILDILIEKIGARAAIRISRNELTNYFHEIIEGLWQGDYIGLHQHYVIKIGEIRQKARKDVEETD